MSSFLINEDKKTKQIILAVIFFVIQYNLCDKIDLKC